MDPLLAAVLRNVGTGAAIGGLAGGVNHAVNPEEGSALRGVAGGALRGGFAGGLHFGTPQNLAINAGVGTALLGGTGALLGAIAPPKDGESRLRNALRTGVSLGDAGTYLGMLLRAGDMLGATREVDPAKGSGSWWSDPMHSPEYAQHRSRYTNPGYHYSESTGTEPPPPPTEGFHAAIDPQEVDWLRNVKTKADAKKAYRAEAMRHHPDRGGDVKKMQDLNNTWDRVQKHPDFQKMAYLGARSALAQFGLSKIAGTLKLEHPVQRPIP